VNGVEGRVKETYARKSERGHIILSKTKGAQKEARNLLMRQIKGPYAVSVAEKKMLKSCWNSLTGGVESE